MPPPLPINKSNSVTTIDRLVAERDAVHAEVASTERELDALVNAPVSGGRDTFECLPDELLVMVLVMLPLAMLWRGACVPALGERNGKLASEATKAAWSGPTGRRTSPQRFIRGCSRPTQTACGLWRLAWMARSSLDLRA
jgi:hypothetical protein